MRKITRVLYSMFGFVISMVFGNKSLLAETGCSPREMTFADYKRLYTLGAEVGFITQWLDTVPGYSECSTQDLSHCLPSSENYCTSGNKCVEAYGVDRVCMDTGCEKIEYCETVWIDNRPICKYEYRDFVVLLPEGVSDSSDIADDKGVRDYINYQLTLRGKATDGTKEKVYWTDSAMANVFNKYFSTREHCTLRWEKIDVNNGDKFVFNGNTYYDGESRFCAKKETTGVCSELELCENPGRIGVSLNQYKFYRQCGDKVNEEEVSFEDIKDAPIYKLVTGSSATIEADIFTKDHEKMCTSLYSQNVYTKNDCYVTETSTTGGDEYGNWEYVKVEDGKNAGQCYYKAEAKYCQNPDSKPWCWE